MAKPIFFALYYNKKRYIINDILLKGFTQSWSLESLCDENKGNMSEFLRARTDSLKLFEI